MNSLVTEWVAKAEVDYKAAAILMQSGETDIYDAICNHAHQCLEKYLKAYLQSQNQAPLKSHDLDELLTYWVALDPTFEPLRSDLVILNPYAVRIRYPGLWAGEKNAKSAYDILLDTRTFIRAKLGI